MADNWERRDILSLGPKFRLDTNNPQIGTNGTNVYHMYAVTDENEICLQGLTEGGTYRVFNDRAIEFIAGNKDSSEGVDIVIAGMSGDVTITAMRNGAVKIKGKNIVIEADVDVDIKAGRNITLDAKQRVLLKGNRCDAKGLLGNLIPDRALFGAQVFENSFVGLDFLKGITGFLPAPIPNVLGTAVDIAAGGALAAATGGAAPILGGIGADLLGDVAGDVLGDVAGGVIESVAGGNLGAIAGGVVGDVLSGGDLGSAASVVLGDATAAVAQAASGGLGGNALALANSTLHTMKTNPSDYIAAVKNTVTDYPSNFDLSIDIGPGGKDNDDVGSQLDAELERAKAGDRSGLDDALDIS